MEKESLDILLADYKTCHDGYMSRDMLVPREFHQMFQSLIFLLALAAGTRTLHSFNDRIELFVLFIIIFIGTLSLAAYAINIEAKASVKRSLRKRMVEIEKAITSDELQYWKAIVQREYFLFENVYKKRDATDNRKEWRSASYLFVLSARILIVIWLVAVSLLLFWDQAFKPVGTA